MLRQRQRNANTTREAKKIAALRWRSTTMGHSVQSGPRQNVNGRLMDVKLKCDQNRASRKDRQQL